MTARMRLMVGGALAASLLFLTQVLVFLTPLPIVYGWLKGGRRLAVSQSVLAGVMVVGGVAAIIMTQPSSSGVLWNEISDLPFSLGYYIVIALVLGWGADHQWSLTRVGLVAATLAMTIKGVGLAIGGGLAPIKGELASAIDQFLTMNAGQWGEMQLAFIRENRDQIVTTVARLIPGGLAALSVMTVALNVMGIRWLGLQKVGMIHAGKLLRWRISFGFVWLVIAAGAVLVTSIYMDVSGEVKYLAINILIVLTSFYLLQGLSVAAFFLVRSRSWLLKMMFYAMMIFMFQVVAIGCVVIGLADQWIDFRRLGVSTTHHKG